jgi:hypothetical protein
MPPSVPTVLFPPSSELVDIGRELISATAAPAYVTIPVAGFEPDDKITMLSDTGKRGSRVKTYDLQQGPIWTESKVTESAVYLDTIGHVLFNAMGDLVSTGTSSGTPWTSTAAALVAGAVAIPVLSGAAATVATYVQVDSGTVSELVTVGAGSTTTNIVLNANTPLRFNHLASITVTPVIAPFTHVFSNLNLNSSTGNTSAQPPTHTLIHRTGIPGSGNYNAVMYAYACFSSVKLSAKATGWMAWEGAVTSQAHAYPASSPTAAISNVKALPGLKSTTTVAGTQRYEIAEWSVDLKAEVEPLPTADGYQNPYAFVRGEFEAPFTLTYNPAIDESALNHYLSNDQPTLAWAITNGLSGANLLSMSIAAQLGGFKGAPLKANKTTFGFDVTGELISNTNNSGNSGGYSPLKITIVNAIPGY